MYRISSIVASVGFIGYIPKGGGTIAAVFTAVLWYFYMNENYLNQTISTALILAIGVWVSNLLENYWGKDSYKIVIDEVLGMMITLLFVPISAKVILTGLVLFRFFDITKILGIRKAEKLSKGWGVMIDDLWAGVYSNILLQVFLSYNLL